MCCDLKPLVSFPARAARSSGCIDCSRATQSRRSGGACSLSVRYRVPLSTEPLRSLQESGSVAFRGKEADAFTICCSQFDRSGFWKVCQHFLTLVFSPTSASRQSCLLFVTGQQRFGRSSNHA